MFFLLYTIWISILMCACVSNYIRTLNFNLIGQYDFEKHFARYTEDFYVSFAMFPGGSIGPVCGDLLVTQALR